MKRILSLIWSWWKKIGLVIGNFVSAIFLTIFYFTVLALVALPFLILSNAKNKESTYIIKKSTISTLKEFESE